MNRKSRKKNKNYRKTILQGASLALLIAGNDHASVFLIGITKRGSADRIASPLVVVETALCGPDRVT